MSFTCGKFKECMVKFCYLKNVFQEARTSFLLNIYRKDAWIKLISQPKTRKRETGILIIYLPCFILYFGKRFIINCGIQNFDPMEARIINI